MLLSSNAARFSWEAESVAFRGRLRLVTGVLILIQKPDVDSRQQFLDFFRLFEQRHHARGCEAGFALGGFVAGVALEQAFRGELGQRVHRVVERIAQQFAAEVGPLLESEAVGFGQGAKEGVDRGGRLGIGGAVEDAVEQRDAFEVLVGLVQRLELLGEQLLDGG